MAYRVLLSQDGRFARFVFSSEVRGADLAEAIRALYQHPRWAVGGHLLVDACAVEVIAVAPEDLPLIEATLHEVSASRAGGRTAVLLGPGAAEALWRRIPELGPRVGRRVAFFHATDEAMAFLGRAALPPVMALVAASASPGRPENGGHLRQV